jgi:hypothetical protein
MNRQWLVVVAVVLAVGLAAALFVRRGPQSDPGAGSGVLSGNTFVDDTLGVMMRLPESPGWTLRREPAGTDGGVATATHTSGLATVRLFVVPLQPDDTIESLFERRQQQLAAIFGVEDLDQLVAEVVHDNRREVAGHPYRQWQALTQPVDVPGEDPARIIFLWVLTTRPERGYEAIGMVRVPAQLTPESQARSDSLLGDVAGVMQSFQVR